MGTSQEESAGTYALNLGLPSSAHSFSFFFGGGEGGEITNLLLYATSKPQHRAKIRREMAILHYLKKCWLKDFNSSTIWFLYPLYILDGIQIFRVIPNNLFTVQDQCVIVGTLQAP